MYHESRGDSLRSGGLRTLPFRKLTVVQLALWRQIPRIPSWK